MTLESKNELFNSIQKMYWEPDNVGNVFLMLRC